MKSSKIGKLFLGIIVALVTMFLMETVKEDSYSFNESEGLMSVHFIDVGQADSAFIELPNKETMLIDAGEKESSDVIKNYIDNLGYKRIDYVVGTHPHTDHIGGLSEVIDAYDIGKIYMPKVVSTTKTYENLLNTIDEKGLNIISAKSGVNIINSDDVKIDIIAPSSEKYDDINNYSAVIRITYNDNIFLFMADAEALSEKEITSSVKADVIKVGHHGSNSSSSKDFVNKVSPKYAIISVGKDNKYNHPSDEIVERWENLGATVLTTMENGTIVFDSDGVNIKLRK